MVLGTLPAVLVGLFGLIAIVAAALAVARASYARQTVESLRGDVSDYEKRVTRLEREKEELKGSLAQEVAKREALENIVVGHEALAEVKEILLAHEERAKDVQTVVKSIDRTVKSIDRKVAGANA